MPPKNVFTISLVFILANCSNLPSPNSIGLAGEAECTLTLSKTILQIINSAPSAVSTINFLFSDASLKICYTNLLPRALMKVSLLPQQLTTENASNFSKLSTQRFTTPANLVLVLYHNSSTIIRPLT